ncbi:hypothetical protein [Shouchella shacheensis]|uniref:hypothetical protein n=1 Tax=Shouchella shacheensis TaxID=1649580 RepID=UPI00073FB94D|nr:hypothetical protein [Shouchella shacheensis]
MPKIVNFLLLLLVLSVLSIAVFRESGNQAKKGRSSSFNYEFGEEWGGLPAREGRKSDGIHSGSSIGRLLRLVLE